MVDWLWIDTRAWGYLVYTNIFLNIILPSTDPPTGRPVSEYLIASCEA